MLNVITLLIVLTAIFAYWNHRYTKLPMTIGVMAIALIISLLLIGLDKLGFSTLHSFEQDLLKSVDFTTVLMQGMLSLLLFAAALHIDIGKLKSHRWQIGALAIGGTVASAIFIGFGSWYALSIVGITLPLGFCMLFGALISPTDPIAVLTILRSTKVAQDLEITIAGESLFNDGIGVVLFLLILETLGHAGPLRATDVISLFIQEALGGAVFGLLVGYAIYRILKNIDNYQVEILITLAAVMGGYALANALHVSGPIAMVVVGLVIGNQGRTFAMSKKTRENLDTFWELIDAILNAVLFVLLGLEIVSIAFPYHSLLASAMIIFVVVGARVLTVAIPVALGNRWIRLPPGSAWVLAWGGVRGGISVALALSLPHGREREIIVMLTYSVVLFSIFGQGLTIGRLVKWVNRRDKSLFLRRY